MGCILGVDFGLRRLGLAVSDPQGALAVALRTVEVTSDEDACAAVAAACGEKEAARVVVGLPVSLNGTPGPMARRVEAFVERLARTLSVPVEVWDERLTTGQVERSLLEADISRARRRRWRDKLAAQVLLQSYLDAHASSPLPGARGEEEA